MNHNVLEYLLLDSSLILYVATAIVDEKTPYAIIKNEL